MEEKKKEKEKIYHSSNSIYAPRVYALERISKKDGRKFERDPSAVLLKRFLSGPPHAKRRGGREQKREKITPSGGGQRRHSVLYLRVTTSAPLTTRVMGGGKRRRGFGEKGKGREKAPFVFVYIDYLLADERRKSRKKGGKKKKEGTGESNEWRRVNHSLLDLLCGEETPQRKSRRPAERLPSTFSARTVSWGKGKKRKKPNEKEKRGGGEKGEKKGSPVVS